MQMVITRSLECEHDAPTGTVRDPFTSYSYSARGYVHLGSMGGRYDTGWDGRIALVPPVRSVISRLHPHHMLVSSTHLTHKGHKSDALLSSVLQSCRLAARKHGPNGAVCLCHTHTSSAMEALDPDPDLDPDSP